MTTMYRMTPITDPVKFEFDLPTRMYHMPMIQKSEILEDSQPESDMNDVSFFN